MLAAFPQCSDNSGDWHFPGSVGLYMGIRVGFGFATIYWNDLWPMKYPLLYICMCVCCTWVCMCMPICLCMYSCACSYVCACTVVHAYMCVWQHKVDNRNPNSSVALFSVIWGKVSLSSWSLLITLLYLASLLQDPVFAFWVWNYSWINTHARHLCQF